MSGTSMDAVDAAIVDFGPKTPRLLAHQSTAWSPTLRERLFSFAAGSPLTADALASLDTETGRFVAAQVNRLLESTSIARAQVDVIGCHGQTVAHLAEANPATTLQLGDANVIAEATGITTINDFRRRDMAAGGQGAPLAPAFHEAVLRDAKESRVVLNLGGIANISVLPADPQLPVTGFDTGPANCLMDGWSRMHLGRPHDDAGAWAASATPDQPLLAALLADPYFDRPPPKSTGTQHFSAHWLRNRMTEAKGLDPAVVQATLAELTVASVAQAIARHAPDTARILVCGGGAKNDHVMRRLADVTGLAVASTADYGVPPQAMETMAFAWLATRTLAGLNGNLPGVTGADGPRILGAIHPA
ncbi:MAG: anhydro-N-acetylmuramic acid kinase [Gammaproteobacteria bacterium]|nr:anhydro-N-acetylmuramic acid kinase [Gammaproteobacteria bacterium]